MKDSRGEPIKVGDIIGVYAYNRNENVPVIEFARDKRFVIVEFPISGGKKKRMSLRCNKVSVVKHKEVLPNRVEFQQPELFKEKDDLEIGMVARILRKGYQEFTGKVIHFPNPDMVMLLVTRPGATAFAPVLPKEEIEVL